MPVYCYQSEKGQMVERVYPIGKAPREITEGDKTFKRCYQAERVGVPPTTGWPITCFASGVAPDQADELRQHFKQVGVPTEVTAEGDPVYRDAAHRRKALKARGFVDRASFV